VGAKQNHPTSGGFLFGCVVGLRPTTLWLAVMRSTD